MTRIARIGIDTSKSVFQLHGVDEGEKIVLQRQLRRQEVLRFLGKLEPTSIGPSAGSGQASRRAAPAITGRLSCKPSATRWC